jgi:hypothetical protein
VVGIALFVLKFIDKKLIANASHDFKYKYRPWIILLIIFIILIMI